MSSLSRHLPFSLAVLHNMSAVHDCFFTWNVFHDVLAVTSWFFAKLDFSLHGLLTLHGCYVLHGYLSTWKSSDVFCLIALIPRDITWSLPSRTTAIPELFVNGTSIDIHEMIQKDVLSLAKSLIFFHETTHDRSTKTSLHDSCNWLVP